MLQEFYIDERQEENIIFIMLRLVRWSSIHNDPSFDVPDLLTS